MARTCRYQAAIIEGESILLIEHRVRASGWGYWVPPGGGIEPGESEVDCIRREVREETHLDVDVQQLLVHRRHVDADPYEESKTFLCRLVGGSPSPGVEPEHGPDPTYDISDVAWISLVYPESWPEAVRSDAITCAFLDDVRQAVGGANVRRTSSNRPGSV